MDVNVLTTLVSSVGFPIVCCGAMAWYIAKRQDRMMTILTKIWALLDECNEGEVK